MATRRPYEKCCPTRLPTRIAHDYKRRPKHLLESYLSPPPANPLFRITFPISADPFAKARTRANVNARSCACVGGGVVCANDDRSGARVRANKWTEVRLIRANE